MNNLESHYNKMVSDAKKGNAMAEANLAQSLEGVEDKEILAVMKDFNKHKADGNIEGMRNLSEVIHKMMINGG